MKSCIRIRACGYSLKADDVLNGTLRLEAICPRISFQAVQIRLLSILPTPLSNSLLNRDFNPNGPKFGYLTLNQTRSVITLLESDPAISLCPIIGIWLAQQFSENRNSEEDLIRFYLANPFVWGACLRYQFSDKIKDRAYISDSTFLLVIFDGRQPLFLEITMLPTAAPEDPMKQPSITSDLFQCLDFTVDLSIDDSIATSKRCMSPSSSPYEMQDPVICKFRPQVTLSNSAVREFRKSTDMSEIFRRRKSAQQAHTQVNEYDALRSSHQLPLQHRHHPVMDNTSKRNVNINANSMFEVTTPQPRNINDIPLPTPPKPNPSPPKPKNNISMPIEEEEIEEDESITINTNISNSNSYVSMCTAEYNSITNGSTSVSASRNHQNCHVHSNSINRHGMADATATAEARAKAKYVDANKVKVSKLVQDGTFSSLVEYSQTAPTDVSIPPLIHAYISPNQLSKQGQGQGQNQGSYFPAEVVLAQQMQIEELRQQISELKNIIISLSPAKPMNTINNKTQDYNVGNTDNKFEHTHQHLQEHTYSKPTNVAQTFRNYSEVNVKENTGNDYINTHDKKYSTVSAETISSASAGLEFQDDSDDDVDVETESTALSIPNVDEDFEASSVYQALKPTVPVLTGAERNKFSRLTKHGIYPLKAASFDIPGLRVTAEDAEMMETGIDSNGYSNSSYGSRRPMDPHFNSNTTGDDEYPSALFGNNSYAHRNHHLQYNFNEDVSIYCESESIMAIETKYLSLK